MSEAKVSVIIPVYNGAHVVAEAVQSVLNQSYRNLEVLVVDDASTDGSPDAIRHFDDRRIKLIRHARNAGVDAARKTGLDASSGDIISCLDQDDMFHPDKVLAHVEYLERHRDVGLTYNPYFIVSHPSRTVQGIVRPPEAVTLEDVYEPYLMQLGFLTRTPRGRCVTAAAYDHLHLERPDGQLQF